MTQPSNPDEGKKLIKRLKKGIYLEKSEQLDIAEKYAYVQRKLAKVEALLWENTLKNRNEYVGGEE